MRNVTKREAHVSPINIGPAIGSEFAAVGCNLILIARRTERIEKLAAELAAGHGITARGLGVDVGDEQALKRALEGEAPDVVICNAGGVVGMDPTETIASDAIDSMINTNVRDSADTSHDGD